MNSLSLVQLALFQKDLEFKIIAKNNLSSMLIGTLMGIVFAFLGYGVWSLVIKQVTTSFVQTALYFTTVHEDSLTILRNMHKY